MLWRHATPFKTLALTSVVLLSPFSSAEENTFTAAKSIPTVIREAVDNGHFSIKRQMPVTELDGVTAFLVIGNDDQEYVYWVDDEQNYVSTGSLITNNGVNLTERYLKLYGSDDTDKLMALNDGGLVLKSSQNTNDNSAMYVFYEPFCGYCKKFHKEIAPYIESGLDVRLVPVSFLRKNSPNVIQALKDSDDLFSALTQSDKGQLATVNQANGDTIAELSKNSKVMRSLGIRGTPGVVYANSDGKFKVQPTPTGATLDRIAKQLISQNTY